MKGCYIAALDRGKPREECGIYAIYDAEEAANFTYLGLYSLQHRGQESAGIVTTDGAHMFRYAGMGQVARVFSQDKIKNLRGRAAIGHNRYSTTGASFLKNAQPIRVESRLGGFALAHNGNLVNAWALRDALEKMGSIFQTTVDSEVIFHLMARSESNDFLTALSDALLKIEGAYSLVILTRDSLYAVRDPHGFRPLVMGKREDGSIVFASETCAFDITDTKYIRDVAPGEMVCVNQKGIASYFPFAEKEKKPIQSLCIFEHIYFSRPDSIIFGQSVYEVRKNLGRYLAQEHPAVADVVVSVPDSSNVASLGYSEESGIPYTIGLIRSHYIGRTFIEPAQKIRDFGARIKYNIVQSAVSGKRVVLVDDSIMRGTTLRKLVKMFRLAGAKEVHVRISAPPTIFPCYYGIDIPNRSELIAATHTKEEIIKYLRVDSLEYMSLKYTLESMKNGKGERKWCTACFSGEYPVAFTKENMGNQKQLFEEEFMVEENQ